MEQSKKNIHLQLAETLALAQQTESRSEAIRLIHLADKLRWKITQENNSYPTY